ncbi:helix-turn-helix domain-containing protein, partial [Vibrio anguillarum]
MKDVGITQYQLAEMMGMSQSAIAHWLGGNRKPSIEEIASILKFVGLNQIALNSDGYVEQVSESISNTSSHDCESQYRG